VDLPSDATTSLQIRPNFDDFSWRSFIALNWPVDPSRRGVPRSPGDPSVFLNAGPTYPSVWNSYREAAELYPPSGEDPLPFDTASRPPVCSQTGLPGAKVLVMATKVGSLLRDIQQAFSFPLVDQNNNYIYYEIRFNRDQYEFVRTNRLYRAKDLMQAEMKAPIAMPISAASPYRAGAVMLKAAWKQMTGTEDKSRYFTLPARIYDTTETNPVCRDVTVGLIALHIGHKVADFPEWVWSSFEQVDNVPNDDGSFPSGRMTLNNGSRPQDPATVGGWANRPPAVQLLPPEKRLKTQVTRLNPIPTTPTGQGTVDINSAYRAALKGTVWANYQLVITQWPANPAQFKIKQAQGVYPDDAGGPFPVNDAVNTAMETYFQSRNDAAGAGGNSCMQCHYNAAETDFSWSLKLRSN
jgi:hypothetical protein